MMSVTPFIIAGTYGTIGALAITAADKLLSQKDEKNDEGKSSFLTDLARNLAIGIFTPIAALGLAKAVVYLKVLPILSSALASFLALSLVAQIVIPVIIIAAIVLVIAIPVLLSRYAVTKEQEKIEEQEELELEGEIQLEDKNDENLEMQSIHEEDISFKNANSAVLEDNKEIQEKEEIEEIEEKEEINETNIEVTSKVEKHEEVISTPEVEKNEEVISTSVEKHEKIISLSLENSADLSVREEDEMNGSTPCDVSSPRAHHENELLEALESSK